MLFSFELDDFQKQAIDSINNDNNVLVTAHTGSGKTVIAEYAIYHNLNKYPTKKVLYVSPIKSLSNEKYKDMQYRFTDKSVGILTGDNKINPDADIIIITAEILRNDFFLNKQLVGNISCCIFDEVHYINDRDRGTVWEEIFVLIDPSIQLVMLSATVSKPHDLSNWITNIKGKSTDLITTSYRIIPLTHYIFQFQEYDAKIVEILDNKDNFCESNYYEVSNTHQKYKTMSIGQKINSLVEYLVKNDMLQTIVFSFSRNKCEQYANLVSTSLIETDEAINIDKIIDKHMHSFKERYLKLHQYNNLLSLIRRGIAYHHSGLVPILKELVEIIFKQGLIKLLFATETFAVGVNMPTRTVVITDIYKMSNTGRRLINTAEYKQISGRAGRRGKDKIGNVILLPMYEFPEKKSLMQVMLGALPHISSKFSLNYLFLLKSIRTEQNIMEIFAKTLMSKQQLSNLDKIQSNLIETQDKINILLIKDQEDSKIDQHIYEEFDKLIELVEMREQYKNINMSFTKQQQKEFTRLNKIIQIKGMKPKYDRYNERKILETDLVEYNTQLSLSKNFIINFTRPLINVLYHFGYLTKNNSENITEMISTDVSVKGTIAVFINECNFIILTELVTSDIFDDLVIQEICAVLAIFIDTKDKDKEEIGLGDLDVSPNINKKISDIARLVNRLKQEETEYNNHADEDFWSLNYNFIDAAYMWAMGCDIREIKGKYDVYEGNFIRNIMKINNICTELINATEVIDNVALMIKLKAIEPLLIRDIVTPVSLYIS